MSTHLGDVVRESREGAGMSLRELSRRSNVDISLLSRLEAHKQHALSPDAVARLAQALDTTVAALAWRVSGYRAYVGHD
jgi:transcriptional regulator with XRE-family HTH domain